MKKLFIIGNGFDIQHGVKSKYSDFHSFIRSIYMNEEILDNSVNEFLPWRYSVPRSNGVLGKFDKSELRNVFGFLDYCLTKSENKEPLFNFYINSDWSSVESTLANLDLREFFSGESNLSTHFSEEDKAYDIAECFKYLYKIFWIWVKEINIDSIKPIQAFQELFDCENDIFFTFNYTRTLEDIYGVKQVRHVHGEQGKEILFGHEKEVNIEAYCRKNGIPSCCEHAIKVLMEITEKDTEKNSIYLDYYYLFLDKDITDIYSYGFSFADVDLPYIRDICKAIDTSQVVWHLSDFDSIKKRNDFMQRIFECGFKGRFTTFEIVNNISNSFCYKRRNINPYSQYIKMKKKRMGRSSFLLHQFILDYYTIGYIRPIQRWKQSDLLIIPRLICIFIFWIFEYISNPFRYIFKKIFHSKK